MPSIETTIVDCPLCGGNRQRDLVSTRDVFFGIGDWWTIVRCLDCGHRFLNPRPTNECLTACYPTDYGPHQQGKLAQDPVGSKEETTSGLTTVNKTVRRPWYLRYLRLDRIPGLKALYQFLTNDSSLIVPSPPQHQAIATEVGCAVGSYLELLREAGWEAGGVELVTEAAQTARSRGFSVQIGTLEHAAMPSATRDLVALWMVLEHVPNPRSTLQAAARLLKPGGRLLLSVPNASSPEAWLFGNGWFGWEPPRHLNHFSPRGLADLLRDVGFSDVEVIHQRTLSTGIGSLGTWWLMRFPQSKLGRRLRDYPHRPRLWIQLVTAVPAILVAAAGGAARITVSAIRTEAGAGSAENSNTDRG